MAYSWRKWENDVTHLNADNLNNIEDGIKQALDNTNVNSDSIVNIKTDIQSLKNEDADLNKKIDDTKEELQNNINEVNSRLEVHENENNPHKVTASQVGAYSKEETLTEAEIRNLISESGGGTGIGGVNWFETLYIGGTIDNPEFSISTNDDGYLIVSGLY